MKIDWDKKYELGHEKIDFGHRIFLNLVSATFTYTDCAAVKERMFRHLKELESYARFHFLSEENLMLDVGYPHLAHHKQEHQMLLSQLDDKVHEYVSQEISMKDIGGFLFEWFAFHTTNSDKQLVQYIKDSNLKPDS